MRSGFFENSELEVAKRNDRPKDGAHLAAGVRKAGFPMPTTPQAIEALRSTVAQS